MSSLRVGCDLCQIGTVEQMLNDEQAALGRLFHAEERDYALAQAQPAQHLAGIFAAKEALAKAVRNPSLLGKYYGEVVVSHRDGGAPCLRLSESLAARLDQAGIQILDLSISHDSEYAVAVVLVTCAPEPEAGQEEVRRTRDSQAPRTLASDRAHCHKCLLTLAYLQAQKIADFLIKVEDAQGVTRYLCPVCLRGW